MRFLERREMQPPGGGANSDAGGALDQVRSEADQLLAAGDEAIRNALSAGNSQAFLRAGRQQGGQ